MPLVMPARIVMTIQKQRCVTVELEILKENKLHVSKIWHSGYFNMYTGNQVSYLHI